MFAKIQFVSIYAILLSLGAPIAFAQVVAPPLAVPYDAPPTTIIPRAGSIGRALTPPTYYRAAPQMVPTTVYRPVTAYHPVTGQPYTRWEGASTLDVETQRVATPLPGYGAPFSAYRAPTPVVQAPVVVSPAPAAPIVTAPAYRVPVAAPVARPMNVQGWVDPYSGNVVNAPPPGAYSAYRPVTSVAPAYAVGRPVMSAPVVDYRGAWPFGLRRPAPVAVQYPPAVPTYVAPAAAVAPYAAPAMPYSGQPATYPPLSTTQPIVTPSNMAPSSSDPYYAPPSNSYPSGGSVVPADVRPTLWSSSASPATGGFSSGASGSSTAVNAVRPLVPAQEARPQSAGSQKAKADVNWPSFLPDRNRKPAPVTKSETNLDAEASEPMGRMTARQPAETADPEVRPLRDPNSRIPDLKDHRAPPLVEPRSAGITAPIRRLTLTPQDNVTGHTANPAAK